MRIGKPERIHKIEPAVMPKEANPETVPEKSPEREKVLVPVKK